MLRLWGPVVAWAAAIFAVSSMTFGGGGPGIPDWLSHAGVYAVLGVLLSRALVGGFPRPLSLAGALLVFLIGTLYGVSDEFHQRFVPTRHSSAADVAKDAVGTALGALAYRLAAARWSGATPRKGLA